MSKEKSRGAPRVRRQPTGKKAIRSEHQGRWNYTKELNNSLRLFFMDDSGIIDYRGNHHEG